MLWYPNFNRSFLKIMKSKIYQSVQDQRLDKFLAQQLDQTRNQIENLIKEGFVKVDKKIQTKTGLKLKSNQTIQVSFPTLVPSQGYEVDFVVQVVYEDESIMILNKPSDLVVHDAPSVKEATLVDWLKMRGVRLSTISAQERHGIVHRLDKGTSGLIAIAKTNEAHMALAKQLEDKTMGRYYLAIIDQPLKEDCVIEKPIGRNPNNRLKMGIVASGKQAKTAFAGLSLSNDEKSQLIACKLFTGRTHQIRVHLESFNRHILGDGLYGFKGDKDKISRVYLHAYLLYLVHPVTNEKMQFMANLQDDMKNYLQVHFTKDDYSEKISSSYINSRFDNIF